VVVRLVDFDLPDERGDDGKGCANVLTDDRSAPSGATTYNTCLVQVELASAQR